MTTTVDRPVVYAGPSISRQEIVSLLPNADVRPPVARDDLYRAREHGAQLLVIIDGVFSHHLAVSPREVVEVASDGALVFGASSMGALRAAECWPAGVRGVGLVYRLYRLGMLDTDDEVAVAVDPDREFAAVSLALVNVRYALSRALRAGRTNRPTASRILSTAQRMFFAERTWDAILDQAMQGAAHELHEPFPSEWDIKHRDAQWVVQYVNDLVRSRPDMIARSARADGDPPRFVLRERYPGHDPYLGRSPAELREEILRWLIGSGRYQRFIWALVAGDLDLGGDPGADDAPALRRDALAARLAQITGDVASSAERLWHELGFLDEQAAEVMRWHAITTCAEHARRAGLGVAAKVVTRVREEVAIAHGVRDWAMLRGEVHRGLLFGAIPFDWIEQACESMAYARSAVAAGMAPRQAPLV